MLDTNIFVSAMVFASFDMLAVIQVATTRHDLVLSATGKDDMLKL
jgi:hypothetical protein